MSKTKQSVNLENAKKKVFKNKGLSELYELCFPDGEIEFEKYIHSIEDLLQQVNHCIWSIGDSLDQCHDKHLVYCLRETKKFKKWLKS